MSLLAVLTTALKGLQVNKRRSFLTMLGIIIGIASVILVTSLGAGAQSLILDQIRQRGTDQVAVLAGASDPQGPPAQALGIVVTTLTREDAEALLNKNNVQHIKTVAAYISGSGTLSWQSNKRSVTYTGSTASYQDVERVSVAEGRFFDEREERAGESVVVLGSAVADDIFANQDPVGEFVKIERRNFRVVGVLEPKGSSGFENPDEAVIMPLTTAQRDLLGVRHVSFMRMTIDDEQYLDQTVREVTETLIDRHGEEDFSVRTIADLLTILETVTGALTFFLVSVASIALFVGGVGIMNIMLIAVKQKTREIGLRKAVGARDGDILKQFLIETVILTVLGGVVGMVIGITGAYLAALGVRAAGYSYSFIISPTAIIFSFVVTLLIGLVFGIVPARKAAALNPIDALRYE